MTSVVVLIGIVIGLRAATPTINDFTLYTGTLLTGTDWQNNFQQVVNYLTLGLADCTIHNLETKGNLICDGTFTITSGTGFSGNVTGNLTGNVNGNVTGNLFGNAATVTNGLYTTTQSSSEVQGIWVGTSTIALACSGNSKTATNLSGTIISTTVLTGLIEGTTYTAATDGLVIVSIDCNNLPSNLQVELSVNNGTHIHGTSAGRNTAGGGLEDIRFASMTVPIHKGDTYVLLSISANGSPNYVMGFYPLGN